MLRRLLSSAIARTGSLARLPQPQLLPATAQLWVRNFSDASDKRTGKVKWFNPGKGFGFIEQGPGLPDVFFHQTSIHANGFRGCQEGEDVEFTIRSEEGGRLSAQTVTGPNGAYVLGCPPPPPRFGYGRDGEAGGEGAPRGERRGGGGGRGGGGNYRGNRGGDRGGSGEEGY